MNAKLKKILIRTGVYTWLKNLEKSMQNKAAEKQNHLNDIAFYKQIINENDLCIDVGANIGDKTNVFRTLGARVIAIEPQSKCIKILNKKYKADKAVTILNLGVSDCEGEMELSICDYANTISTMSDKWKNEGRFSDTAEWNKTETVKVSTLDNILAKYGHPKYIKIDVEGFELNVLRGLNKPVNHISFEFTKEFLPETTQIFKHLEKLGKFSVNVLLGVEGKFHFNSYVDYPDIITLIKDSPKDDIMGDIFIKFSEY